MPPPGPARAQRSTRAAERDGRGRGISLPAQTPSATPHSAALRSRSGGLGTRRSETCPALARRRTKRRGEEVRCPERLRSGQRGRALSAPLLRRNRAGAVAAPGDPRSSPRSIPENDERCGVFPAPRGRSLKRLERKPWGRSGKRSSAESFSRAAERVGWGRNRSRQISLRGPYRVSSPGARSTCSFCVC